jgi:glycosyltransferase involved in cell wall biosynthesis
MRIFQVTPAFALGDGVGNHMYTLMRVIESMGYETAIYAIYHAKNVPRELRHDAAKLPRLNRNDVVIYHQAIGNPLADKIAALPCRKIMVYHNITPPHFFEGYSSNLIRLTSYGLENTRMLTRHVDAVWADSEFNKQDILKMGFRGDITVLPILIPFEDYKRKPDEKVLGRFNDGKKHILFVGRIVPNKKQEDIIAAFAYYQKNIDPQARLTLVGNYDPKDPYASRLLNYVLELGLSDAEITGHVSFEQILAYYKTADLFLCLSEHEGFCIPLLEAMSFDIPVLAYDATAVKDTLGGSGVLLPQKDPVFVAMVMDRVLRDFAMRAHIIEGQRKRQADFAYDKVAQMHRDALKAFLETVK